MATVSQNIATIAAQAAILDGIVADFRAAKTLIDAAESEIRMAQPGANHDCIDGRIRLAFYATRLMTEPSITGRKTVAQLASDAWAGVS